MTMLLFVNGKPVDSDRVVPNLFEEDRLSVFESLRSYHGKIFRLGEHLNRLFESAKTVRLNLPKTKEVLEEELIQSLRLSRQQDAFLRLAVDDQNSYIWVTNRSRPAWIYRKGVAIKTVAIRRNAVNAEPPEAKTSAFFNNVLLTLEEHDSEIFESIALDVNGYVTEATSWNIFMVRAQKLFTPQVGILHGVTRQFVIKCAKAEHFPTLESNLTRHDLWNAEEAFLTNTSGEIVPIRSLDGRKIGTQIPGIVTQKLMNRFQKELKKELSHSRTY